MDSKLVEKIKQILDNSDIVWTKYGSQSTDQLAREITKESEDHIYVRNHVNRMLS